MKEARKEDVPVEKIDRLDLSHGVFANKDFRNADLMDVNAYDTQFVKCDFRYSVIDSGYFRNTTFTDCKLDGARFIDCNLKTARFHVSELSYVRFSRCLVDAKQVLAALPLEPNIRRDALQNLKANALETGDYEAVKLFVLEEIKAEKLHLSNAMKGATTYYQLKYPTFLDKVKAGAQLGWLKLKGWIWGHGERPIQLLFSCAVVLVLIGVVNSFSVLSTTPWDVSGGGLWPIKYVFDRFLDMPIDDRFAGPVVMDYLIVLLRYLYIGMFISVLYKAISHR